jgi:Pyridoxamine 5'-phosphate oxidase
LWGSKALDCYLSRHPDAYEWTPDNPSAPHKVSWYKYHVESVYYFGGLSLIAREKLTTGFGNVSYIGFLPIGLYRSIDLGQAFGIQN